MAGENQARIAANHLVDILPELVEAAAKGIAGSNLTILNGSAGVNEIVAGVISQGLAIYGTLKDGLPPSSTPTGPPGQ